MIINFAKQSRNKRSAQQLYGSIVTQARKPFFYSDFNVPDTATCRFEMIVIHMFLILKNLQEKNGKDQEFSQILIETFFSDMDRSLREMGVGDLSVPKKMRKLATAFYVRMADYTKAVETGNAERVANLLDNGIFENSDSVETGDHKIKYSDLADYMLDQDAHISKFTTEQLRHSTFDFRDETNEYR